MDMQEIVVYGLVAGAVLSVGVSFALTGGSGKASVSAREPGWSRLPPIFKMLWGFILLFEDKCLREQRVPQVTEFNVTFSICSLDRN